jgi:hypothetical protein
MDTWKNQLFFGDNLEILRSGRIPVGSVDLIYHPPPDPLPSREGELQKTILWDIRPSPSW